MLLLLAGTGDFDGDFDLDFAELLLLDMDDDETDLRRYDDLQLRFYIQKKLVK